MGQGEEERGEEEGRADEARREGHEKEARGLVVRSRSLHVMPGLVPGMTN
jgi:hypothetical protein